MLAAALRTVGLAEPPDARLLWIADTLDLGEVECSTAYLADARQRPDLEILTAPRVALRRGGQSAGRGSGSPCLIEGWHAMSPRRRAWWSGFSRVPRPSLRLKARHRPPPAAGGDCKSPFPVARIRTLEDTNHGQVPKKLGAVEVRPARHWHEQEAALFPVLFLFLWCVAAAFSIR